MDDDVREYLSLLKEEYRTLYDQSERAGRNIMTILQLGAAGLVAVIAAGFTQWNKQHEIVLLTFYIVIPIIDALIIALWLGEVATIKRAADYKIMIEQKTGMILDKFKFKNGIKEDWEELQKQIEVRLSIPHTDVDLSDPLAWEQWLKNTGWKEGTSLYLYFVFSFRLSFFILIIIFSFLIGTYYTLTHKEFEIYFPTWLDWFRNIMSKTENDISLLITLSIIIIISTIVITIATVSALKLFAKVEPIIRPKPSNKNTLSGEVEHNNAKKI